MTTAADARNMLLELAASAEATGNAYAGEKLRSMAETPERFLRELQGEFLASSLDPQQLM